MEQEFLFTAKTLGGLEEHLLKEIESAGAQNILAVENGFQFSGDDKLIYTLNYTSRLGIRFLKQVLSFDFDEKQTFYDKIYRYAWNRLIFQTQTMNIEAVCEDNAIFGSARELELFTKEAIEEHFGRKYGERPVVSKNNPDLLINIQVLGKTCTVKIDTSGESLHRRGYRVVQGDYPLNEVLAAGIIAHTGWDFEMPIIDPMCGSGTLLIEAAMLASGIPAGYYRKSFGFMRWKDFNQELWEEVKQAASMGAVDFDGRITGLDNADDAIKNARKNIFNAKMDRDIEVHKTDFFRSRNSGEPALLVFNPPDEYRLKDIDPALLYKRIGDHLQSQYAGSKAWIFVPHEETVKSLGLEPVKRVTLFNGKHESRLFCFDLTQTSNKTIEHEEYTEDRSTDIGG